MATYPTSPRPSYEYVEEAECSVAVTRYSNGTEQRIKQADILYRFRLAYDKLRPIDLDTLWAFYVARGGPLETFNYASIRTGTNFVVRFDMQAMSRGLFRYQLERTGVELVEVKGESPPA